MTKSKDKYQYRELVAEDVLKFVMSYKQAHDGNSPTVREICTCCGIGSTSHVFYYLVKLEVAGKIRLSGLARSIEVVGGEWSCKTNVQLTNPVE